MAKTTTRAQRAKSAAAKAGSNPYLKRIVEDEELRESVVTAFEAARAAYDRLSSNGSVIDTAIDDKKLHKDLKQAAEALKEAGAALKEGPERKPKRKKGGIGRKLLLLVVGAAIALALSEDLRNKVLDLLFGKEEEFDYGSTAAPAGANGGAS